MTQAPLTNGVLKLTVNGLKAKAHAASQPPTPSPVVDSAARDSDLHPNYLNSYTLEEIVKARPISDPYQGILLPPYARSTKIDVGSFRTGHVPTPDELAAELRITYEGQIPLAEILDRVVQDTYAKLTELAEVCVFLTRTVQGSLNQRVSPGCQVTVILSERRRSSSSRWPQGNRLSRCTPSPSGRERRTTCKER